MIVIICGGRDYPPFTASNHLYLDRLRVRYAITEVVTGGAPGVDTEASKWAAERGINQAIFPANWKGEGRAAGPKRNRRMAAYAISRLQSSRVIAFPGGRGTADMCQAAEEYGIPVLRYPEVEEPTP